MNENYEHTGQLKVRTREYSCLNSRHYVGIIHLRHTRANLLSVIQTGYNPSAKSKHAKNGNKHLLKHIIGLHFQCHLL